MLEQDERFESTGDDALANQVRDAVKELNLVTQEAKKRGIVVTITTPRGMGFKVESITAERKL